jgi:hypothetical protein
LAGWIVDLRVHEGCSILARDPRAQSLCRFLATADQPPF